MKKLTKNVANVVNAELYGSEVIYKGANYSAVKYWSAAFPGGHSCVHTNAINKKIYNYNSFLDNAAIAGNKDMQIMVNAHIKTCGKEPMRVAFRGYGAGPKLVNYDYILIQPN